MTTNQRDVLAGIILLHELRETPPRHIAYYIVRYMQIRKELTDYDFNQQVHEAIEEVYDTRKLD